MLNFLGKAVELAPLALRIMLGVAFAFHGYGKLVPADGFDAGAAFADHAAALAPKPLLYLAAWTEFVGGLAVFAGLLTRWASLGLLAVMGYAIFRVHWSQGFLYQIRDGQGQGWEFAAAYASMCIALVVLGPGSLSLDRLFFKKDALNQ